MGFDWSGVEVEQHYTNMQDGTQSQIHFHDVAVPEENVLTRGKEEFKNQLKALNWERSGCAALANSLGMNALDKALDYAQQPE